METGAGGGWGPLGALPVVFSCSFSLPQREEVCFCSERGSWDARTLVWWWQPGENSWAAWLGQWASPKRGSCAGLGASDTCLLLAFSFQLVLQEQLCPFSSS